MSGLFQKGKEWSWAGLIFVVCWAAGAAHAAEWFVATNGNDAADGASWETAKLTIQAGIDAAVSNDTVWVSNGVYATGGRAVYGAMTNRVVIDKPITVQSTNGPAVTIIQGAKPNGDAAVRCVFLATNALLSGFTLTNGATRKLGDFETEQSGGGAYGGGEYGGGTLSNCVLRNNTANREGGGTFNCRLIDCTLIGNAAGFSGGGSCGGALSNCTFIGNSSASGGGATMHLRNSLSGIGFVNNCTFVSNSAGSGGGTMYGWMSQCSLIGNTASNSGGGSAMFGYLSDCVLSNNIAPLGGGAYQCTLTNCLLAGNTATNGGGDYLSYIFDSTLIGNTARERGGGAYWSKLVRCTLASNSAYRGGGTYGSSQNMCRLTGNIATSEGGGSYDGTLNNCVLENNVAGEYGGGSRSGTLNNCTVANNSADLADGGSFNGTLNNCIVYYNWAPFSRNGWGTFNFSCTTPDPGGTGNITNSPGFVNSWGDYRLRTNSPCINRGSNAFVQGTTDLNGNPRIAYGTVDMGAYEAQFPVGYWAWAAAVTNGLTNDTDCAAGDGMPNLLKYATGGSPMEADGLARLDLAFDGGLPTLRFNRNPNATDVTLVIQGADEMSDAAEWRGLATNRNGSWGGASNVNESGQGNPVACAVQDPVPLFTNRFLRLKVTRP